MNNIYIESPESEAKYQRLKELGLKHKIPVPEVFIEIEMTMPDGSIPLHFRRRSHSLVRNFYNLSYNVMSMATCNTSGFGLAYVDVKDTAGAIRPLTNNYGLFIGIYSDPSAFYDDGETINRGFRGSGSASGVLVGSSQTAESYEDYRLISQIADGESAGQLTYTPQETIIHSWSTDTWTARYWRYFNNNSGGVVNVGETALVGKISFGNVLVTRDIHDPIIQVLNTAQLKVIYELSLTYP